MRLEEARNIEAKIKEKEREKLERDREAARRQMVRYKS